jgi:hypothetical protein
MHKSTCRYCNRSLILKEKGLFFKSYTYPEHSTRLGGPRCINSGGRPPSIIVRSAEAESRVTNSKEAHASAERAAQWALKQTGQQRPGRG